MDVTKNYRRTGIRLGEAKWIYHYFLERVGIGRKNQFLS
jgi:hypothetical protein